MKQAILWYRNIGLRFAKNKIPTVLIFSLFVYDCRWSYQTTMKTNEENSLLHMSSKPPYKPFSTTFPRPLTSPGPGLIINETSKDKPNYKPTFRPPVLVAEISNLEALASITSSTSPPNLVKTTTIDEKNQNISSFLNDLSSNSVINAMVIFGLPMATALMSLLGAGPLAIASVAWIIPVAAILILPDLQQGET